MLISSSSIHCTLSSACPPRPRAANRITRNLSSSSHPKTPPSSSSNRPRGPNDGSTPPNRPSVGGSGSSPPFKNYINFLSNTNDDWKADEDEMMGYEDDDGDDFGLPSLSNMKRRTRKIASQSKPEPDSLSPGLDGGYFGSPQPRRYSNSADIAVERPSSTYPMPKKSEGKILRPQYKEILRGMSLLARAGLDLY